MALRGNLDSLQATEVLQLLAQSGKSGTLVVHDDRKSKLLEFEKGQIVHAVYLERLPSIEKVLYQRGTISREQMDAQRDAQRFDDEVVRIVARRRVGTSRRGGQRALASGRRFGRILVKQGQIRQQDLDFALDPLNVPDELLYRIVVDHGKLHLPDSAEARQRVAGDDSLYQGLIRLGLATAEDIDDAIAEIDEATLIELLVHHGLTKKGVVQQLAARLDSLREHERPQMRFGSYLVARGLVSQRQLEKALGKQISSDSRLGDIVVKLGLMSEEDLRRAEEDLALLRLEYSPLHPVLCILREEHGFTTDELASIVAQHRKSELTLTDLLAETGRIDVPTARKVFTEVVILEIADLLTWQDERYEFFEEFYLQDVLPQEPVSRLHRFSFDFNSLLLDAHYRVDEADRTTASELSPQTILSLPSLGFDKNPEVTQDDRRLLERIDGCRPIADVCRVLPGNPLRKRDVMRRMVDLGWAVKMTRQQAFETASEWLKRGDGRQAILNYEHAIATPGDQPTDAQLRLAIQAARLSTQSVWMRRVSRVVHKDVSCIAALPPFRQIARLWQRLQTLLQEVLIRRGLARRWWSIKASVLRPIRDALQTATARTAIGLLALGAVGLLITMSSISSIEPEAERAASTGDDPVGQPRETRPSIRRIETGGPLQVEPRIVDSSVLFVSRDGFLRSVPLPGTDGAEWSAELGEFGDVLSPPSIAKDRVFVANVRGQVHAVSTAGEILWRTELGRVEAVEPLPLFAPPETGPKSGSDGGEPKPSCVAVASRDSIVLLSVETGLELARLQTGNRILARPLVDGSRLFVGSTDDHLYCFDWQAREVLWDQELEDDVQQLVGCGDRIAVLVRGDRVVTCDARTGRVAWRHDLGGHHASRFERLRDGSIGVETGKGRRLNLDTLTGQVRQSFEPPRSLGVVRSGVVGGLYLYVAEDGHVGGLDSAGRHLWRSEASVGQVTSWALGEDVVALATEGGVLELLPLKRD